MGDQDSAPARPRVQAAPAVTSRRATVADAALLAGMNQQLIEDEASPNPMTLAELTARMQDFLDGAYSAVLFELEAEPVGYALFRADGDGMALRQFFISRAHRRSGIGREAVATLFSEHFPLGCRVTVDVLVTSEATLKFWESVGFRQHAITLEYLAPPAPSG